MLNGRKRKLFMFLIVCSIVLGIAVFKSFSQWSTNWGNVSFATHTNFLKFFDHTTGKIYVYSELDGKLYNIWVLEDLGKDLRNVYRGR